MNSTPARIALLLSMCLLMAVSTGSGQSSGSSGGSFGVRGGVGTDVELGLGFGAVVASMQWEETETAPNWTATFVPTATLSLAYRFR